MLTGALIGAGVGLAIALAKVLMSKKEENGSKPGPR